MRNYRKGERNYMNDTARKTTFNFKMVGIDKYLYRDGENEVLGESSIHINGRFSGNKSDFENYEVDEEMGGDLGSSYIEKKKEFGMYVKSFEFKNFPRSLDKVILSHL